MNNVKSERKLRNFLINPKFQLRYILWITFNGIFLVLLLNTIFYLFINENYLTLVELSPMNEDVKNQLNLELSQLKWILSGASIIFITVVSIIGLVFSHKAAGPIFHLQRVIKEVRDGKKGIRVKYRPNDEFKETLEEFNQMLDHLESK